MRDKQRRWLALLPMGVLFLSMLACGGFQVRGTPAPSPTPRVTASAPATSVAQATSAPTPTQASAAGSTATPAPQANAGILTPGGKAKVAADLVNVRSEAKAGAAKTGSLPSGTVVTLTGGPVAADDYTWYKVDNGSGVTGWVASGPADSPWIVPEAGSAAVAPTPSGPRLVDRAVKAGDRVQVTVQENQELTLRGTAGKDGEAVAKVLAGTQLTVKGGPEQKDGLTWWQIDDEKYKGWVAEGDGETRWLTPVE